MGLKSVKEVTTSPLKSVELQSERQLKRCNNDLVELYVPFHSESPGVCHLGHHSLSSGSSFVDMNSSFVVVYILFANPNGLHNKLRSRQVSHLLPLQEQTRQVILFVPIIREFYVGYVDF